MKTKMIFAFLVLFQVSIVKASFTQGQQRYISGPEFAQRITDIGIKIPVDANCLALTESNEDSLLSLGLNPPALGRPLFASPTAGTIQVLSDCVMKSMILNSSTYSEEDLDAFISEDSRKTIYASNSAFKTRQEQLTIKWSRIPVQIRYYIIADLVERIIGTDAVLEDYGLVKNAEDMRHEIFNQLETQDSEVTVVATIQKIVVTLILRDEFLSY